MAVRSHFKIRSHFFGNPVYGYNVRWHYGILLSTYLMMYYYNNVYQVCFIFVWCPCMAIDVSVQYNGGFLPDIILLTQGYYNRRARLNSMKIFLRKN